ncbi:unnamed protein product [Bartonella apis]|uniref:gp53-like domain-containing protein n=1 Tax=Bartonella apis TaxID=1686310 RepID=UPI003997788F
MALLPNFPISGDDYTVGTITTVAGSKEFKTKDAYLQSYGAVQAGDHIYIAQAAKFLIIGSITGENSGTLTDPCPADCAVTDADLRIIFKTASSRLQGRTAMLLERLSKGCLASLAELSPTEGQIFRATNVEGQLEAVDNTADNVIETDNRKFMTDKDRQSIANIDKRVSDLTTAQIKETDTAKIMTAAERVKLANINALAATIWNAGADGTEALVSPVKLRDAINARFGGNPESGWVRMPNDLLIQWGNLMSINNGYGRVVFPTAFTKSCFFLPTMAQAWTGEWFAPLVFADWGDNPNLGAKGVHCRQIAGTSGVSYLNSCNVQWIAIGY